MPEEGPVHGEGNEESHSVQKELYISSPESQSAKKEPSIIGLDENLTLYDELKRLPILTLRTLLNRMVHKTTKPIIVTITIKLLMLGVKISLKVFLAHGYNQDLNY